MASGTEVDNRGLDTVGVSLEHHAAILRGASHRLVSHHPRLRRAASNAACHELRHVWRGTGFDRPVEQESVLLFFWERGTHPSSESIGSHLFLSTGSVDREAAWNFESVAMTGWQPLRDMSRRCSRGVLLGLVWSTCLACWKEGGGKKVGIVAGAPE